MLTKIRSLCAHGISPRDLTIEVDVANKGFPCFDIVGLGDKSITESRQRIKTAINNSNLKFPSDKKIVVNLAPADLAKEGSYFDVAIAIGILRSVDGFALPEGSAFLGELSLDGTCRLGNEVFFLVLGAAELGFKKVYIPSSAAPKIRTLTSSVDVVFYDSISCLYEHLAKGRPLVYTTELESRGDDCSNDIWLQDSFTQIIGQEKAKKALILSAAGGHNLLMMGPPGAGKTFLARSIMSIIPGPDSRELQEINRILSVSGRERVPVFSRTFRSPHHTSSYTALLGGGKKVKPGEVTLAHLGVLFLDELTEFRRDCIEALRQPLEDGFVTISRANESQNYPAEFTLVAACNPCPCGYFGHPDVSCRCTARQIVNYRKKLSGPLLDRIDLQLVLNPITSAEVFNVKNVKSNITSIRVQTAIARLMQGYRLRRRSVHVLPAQSLNARMTNDDISHTCVLDDSARACLEKASSKYKLSTRACFKVIKVARTVADLSLAKEIIVNKYGTSACGLNDLCVLLQKTGRGFDKLVIEVGELAKTGDLCVVKKESVLEALSFRESLFTSL